MPYIWIEICVLINLTLIFRNSGQETAKWKDGRLSFVNFTSKGNQFGLSDNESLLTVHKRDDEIAKYLRETFQILLKYHKNGNSKIINKREVNAFSSWSLGSCCRRNINSQTRFRIVNEELQIQYRKCCSNVCPVCQNTFQACNHFQVRFNACLSSSSYNGFMCLFCPETCKVCSTSAPANTLQPETSGNQSATTKPNELFGSVSSTRTSEEHTNPSVPFPESTPSITSYSTTKSAANPDNQTQFATNIPNSLTLSDFDIDCLERHNFYRALQNSPPLKWSPTLANSAQLWAEKLKRCAPDGKIIGRSNCRILFFPHSQSNGVERPLNTGENIAYNFGNEESLANVTVIRWYSEILNYDRKKPTANLSDQPTGHFTQLVWKSTDTLGCGRATTRMDREGRSEFSTWIVAQYAPAGNIIYASNEIVAKYDQEIPPLRKGTCKSPSPCGTHFGCLGFHSSFTCTCSEADNTPICKGEIGGCFASCPISLSLQAQSNNSPWKTECEGNVLCRCSYQSISGRRGAICV